jgi:hypothetical protein
VVVSTLAPVKAGDRVKIDHCDAAKLARCYGAGDLTPVWVPDADHQALRGLVPTQDAKPDLQRAPNGWASSGCAVVANDRRASNRTAPASTWTESSAKCGPHRLPCKLPFSTKCTKCNMLPTP